MPPPGSSAAFTSKRIGRGTRNIAVGSIAPDQIYAVPVLTERLSFRSKDGAILNEFRRCEQHCFL